MKEGEARIRTQQNLTIDLDKYMEDDDDDAPKQVVHELEKIESDDPCKSSAEMKLQKDQKGKTELDITDQSVLDETNSDTTKTRYRDQKKALTDRKAKTLKPETPQMSDISKPESTISEIGATNPKMSSNKSELSEQSSENPVIEKDKSRIVHGPPAQFLVLPLYSMLPPEKQMRVFSPVDPLTTRLVVVATNIAETSITIPGITYVVDSGRVKSKGYDPRTGIQFYQVTLTSKASANQRAGRAGRTGPGWCYRIYSSAAFNTHFPDFAPPEILKAPIDSVILSMKNMGISKIESFPFPTPPENLAIRSAIQMLCHLGALQNNVDDTITGLGKAMVKFPVSPRFAKMLVLGNQGNCLDYIIIIVAIFSVGNPLLNITHDDKDSEDKEDKVQQKERQKEVQKIHSTWKSPVSDPLTWLNAVGAVEYAGNRDSFCVQHYLHTKTVREIHELCQQLTRIVKQTSTTTNKQKNRKKTRAGTNEYNSYLHGGEDGDDVAQLGEVETSISQLAPPTREQKTIIRQVITSGLIDQVARRIPELDEEGKERRNRYKYQTCTSNTHVYVHPTSVLYSSPPEFVAYYEVISNVEGTKTYIKGLTAIQPEWLTELGGSLVSYSPPLETPPVHFDPEDETIKCYVTPLFGPYKWELPYHKISIESGLEKYKYFAKFVLDGSVFPFLKKYQAYLKQSPNMIIKQWHEGKMIPTVQPLLDFQIDTKAKMLTRWKKDRSFYLPVLVKWFDESQHSQIQKEWSSLLK
eukprot:TRINITY_DN6259_c0_g1_i3.p1 TRINITY_DN6259_c0_g1~~TRINITY_DN6259_c0_g1_i3.p1  ORF type:complete len:751 (-),score=181.37 TRINITY_DN6259_c0_g1_i3:320-2572(-)